MNHNKSTILIATLITFTPLGILCHENNSDLKKSLEENAAARRELTESIKKLIATIEQCNETAKRTITTVEACTEMVRGNYYQEEKNDDDSEKQSS
jgi:hypothetical protein